MPNKAIRRFFIAIGVFYLLNLVGLIPAFSKELLGVMYPAVQRGFEGIHLALLQDAWFVVGAQLGAVGVVALWAARQPSRYAGLIPVVVAIELFDAAWDIYSMVFGGETLWFGLLTLVIHVFWIVWALRLWRQVR